MPKIRISTFGQALRLLREEEGLDYRDLANRIGVEKQTIKTWEADAGYPSAQQLKRLYGSMRRLRYFAHLLPKMIIEAAFTGVDDAIRGGAPIEEAIGQWVPQLSPDHRDVPDDISFDGRNVLVDSTAQAANFGDALRRARLREGLAQDELAELLNVTGQAVSQWERNEASPVAEHFAEIIKLLPQLSSGPKPSPDPRNIPKPDGGAGLERQHATIKTNSLPPIPSPPKAIQPRVDMAIGPPLSTTVILGKTQTQLESAGAEYARTLAAKSEGESKLAKLKEQIHDAENALQALSADVENAHKRLVEIATNGRTT